MLLATSPRRKPTHRVRRDNRFTGLHLLNRQPAFEALESRLVLSGTYHAHLAAAGDSMLASTNATAPEHDVIAEAHIGDSLGTDVTFQTVGELTIGQTNEIVTRIQHSFDIDRNGEVSISDLTTIRSAIDLYLTLGPSQFEPATNEVLSENDRELLEFVDGLTDFLSVRVGDHDEAILLNQLSETAPGQRSSSLPTNVRVAADKALLSAALAYFVGTDFAFTRPAQWEALGTFVDMAGQYNGDEFHAFRDYVQNTLFAQRPGEDTEQHSLRFDTLNRILLSRVGSWSAEQSKLVVYQPGSRQFSDQDYSIDHLNLLRAILANIHRTDNRASQYYRIIALGEKPEPLTVADNVMTLAMDSSIEDVLAEEARIWWQEASQAQQVSRFRSLYEQSVSDTVDELGDFVSLEGSKNALDDFQTLYAQWNIDGRALLVRALGRAVRGKPLLLNKLLFVGVNGHVNRYDHPTQTFYRETLDIEPNCGGCPIQEIFLDGKKYRLTYVGDDVTSVDIHAMSPEEVARTVETLAAGSWDVDGDGSRNASDIEIIRDAYRTYWALGEAAFVGHGSVAMIIGGQDDLPMGFLSGFEDLLAGQSVSVDNLILRMRDLSPFLRDVFIDDVLEHAIDGLIQKMKSRPLRFSENNQFGHVIEFIRDYGGARWKDRIHELLDGVILERSTITGETEEQFQLRRTLVHQLWSEFGIVVYYDRQSFLDPSSDQPLVDHALHLDKLQAILGIISAGYPPYQNIVSVMEIGQRSLGDDAGRYGTAGHMALGPQLWVRTFMHEYAHGVDEKVLIYQRDVDRTLTQLFRESMASGDLAGDFVSSYAQRNWKEEFAELVAFWGWNSSDVLNRALERARDGKSLLLEKLLLLQQLYPDDGRSTMNVYRFNSTKNELEVNTLNVFRDLRGRLISLQSDGITYLLGYGPDTRLATITPIDALVSFPGDANGDGVFDVQDLAEVLERRKYLTNQDAVWEEGDWNGDSTLDQNDIVAALATGMYV